MKEKSLLAFLTEIEKLKSTLRHNWTRIGRQESSAEHSWRIAVFFMIAYDTFDLQVDFIKTIKMILIHDIAELSFGDIPAFIKDTDPESHKNHKEREKEAAREIFSLLPEPLNKEYLDLLLEEGEGKTPEAKVAKALDRIESQLQHLESGPTYWSKEEMGDHMLHYPDTALKNLDNKNISSIWSLIHEQLEKLQ